MLRQSPYLVIGCPENYLNAAVVHSSTARTPISREAGRQILLTGVVYNQRSSLLSLRLNVRDPAGFSTAGPSIWRKVTISGVCPYTQRIILSAKHGSHHGKFATVNLMLRCGLYSSMCVEGRVKSDYDCCCAGTSSGAGSSATTGGNNLHRVLGSGESDRLFCCCLLGLAVSLDSFSRPLQVRCLLRVVSAVLLTYETSPTRHTSWCLQILAVQAMLTAVASIHVARQ